MLGSRGVFSILQLVRPVQEIRSETYLACERNKSSFEDNNSSPISNLMTQAPSSQNVHTRIV
jgi:hypothetical protein